MHTTTVAVIAFDNVNPFLLSVPCSVFGVNRLDADKPRFRIRVCAAEDGELVTNAGFSILTECNLSNLTDAEIVIVPSWRDADEIPPHNLLTALREAYSRGATIVGLCMGAFVLAAAGLLSGRPATTHWMLTEKLAGRYPDIDVKPDVLYVDDGDVITSAGVAAGIDCCLHILRRLHGAEAASRVARRMVMPPHRQGGQAQYIQMPIRKNAAEDRFTQNLEWVEGHLGQPHTLDSLAERFMMSRRTFTRRFRQVTGVTVGAWLLSRRLSMAQRLLETTTKPIGVVAQEAGFGSEVSLRCISASS